MNNEARTLYYEDNIILITTEGVAHVSIDDDLFDFSYELEPKNIHGCLAHTLQICQTPAS